MGIAGALWRVETRAASLPPRHLTAGNHQRRHSHNGYLSPVEFELKAQIAAKAA